MNRRIKIKGRWDWFKWDESVQTCSKYIRIFQLWPNKHFLLEVEWACAAIEIRNGKFANNKQSKISICNNSLQSCLFLSKSQSKTVLIMLCIDFESSHRPLKTIHIRFIWAHHDFIPLKWRTPNWKCICTRTIQTEIDCVCVLFSYPCIGRSTAKPNRIESAIRLALIRDQYTSGMFINETKSTRLCN